MKVRFLLSISCLFICCGAYSQQHSFGFHAIGNYTNFHAEVIPVLGNRLPEWKTGYGIGGNFTYELNEIFGLRGEVNLERLGAKYDFQFTDENGNPIEDNDGARISLDYASVPILLQIKTGEKYQFMFNLGTAFKLLINQAVQNPWVIEMQEKNYWPGFDKLSDYNRTDQSIQCGIGYSFPFIKSSRIYVNSRYEHGLLKVSKKDEFFTGKNRSFSILIGVQI